MLEDDVDVKPEEPDSVAREFKSRFRDVGRLGGSMYRSYLRMKQELDAVFQHESLASRVWRGTEYKVCAIQDPRRRVWLSRKPIRNEVSAFLEIKSSCGL